MYMENTFMTQANLVTPLTPDELKRIEDRLGAVLSYAWVQAADPFLPSAHVVVEESSNGFERLYGGLARVLKCSSQPRFYAIQYGTENNQCITLDCGHAIPGGLNQDTFDALGYDIGYLINGMDFILCDDTGLWAIITTTDVVIVGGGAEYVNAFYADKATQLEASAAFDAFVTTGDVRSSYTAMRRYRRG